MKSEDWKKLRLKNAEYAHITEETIFVSFRKRVNCGSNYKSVEWCEVYPNDTILISKHSGIDTFRSVFIGRYMVGYLKDIFKLGLYGKNTTEAMKSFTGHTVNNKSVYVHTKKGEMSFNNISIDGKNLIHQEVEILH